MNNRLIEITRHAEEQVLGSALLATPAELASYIDALGPDDFNNSLYGQIWNAIRSTYEKHGSVDYALIVDTLVRSGRPMHEAIDDIIRLTECVATSAHLEYFVKQVRNFSILRGLSKDARRLLTHTEKSAQASEIIDTLQILATRYAANAGNNGKAYSITDVLEAIRRSIDEAIQSTWEADWPFECLQEPLGPIRPGRLYVIGARPGMGKTTFICDLVRLLDAPCSLICLEGTVEDMGRQIIAAASGVQRRKLERPSVLNREEINQILSASAYIAECPISIIAPSNRTLAHLYTICRSESLKGARVIVIDYIQQLSDASRRYSGDGRNWELGAIARGLTQIAREIQVAVIATSQLSRQNERRMNHLPRLSDLRESGEIEQEAHAVMLLHRPAYYDPEADDRCIIEIAKNRSGPKARVYLRFASHIPRCEEVPDGFYCDSKTEDSPSEQWYMSD